MGPACVWRANGCHKLPTNATANSSSATLRALSRRPAIAPENVGRPSPLLANPLASALVPAGYFRRAARAANVSLTSSISPPRAAHSSRPTLSHLALYHCRSAL